MNDDNSLCAVRDALTAAEGALTETHMHTPLDTIVRRGRAARRRHRLIGLTGTAAVATIAALVLGLGGLAPTHSTGTIRTAAFTLVSHANGLVTLTVNIGVLVEPRTLQSDLAQDGIPAIVTVGSFCSSNPAPAVPANLWYGTAQSGMYAQSPPTITFDPALLPAGTELSFSFFQLSGFGSNTGVQEDAFTLIDTSSYACTSTAPTPAKLAGHGAVVTIGPNA
jgi:hypothetical protein